MPACVCEAASSNGHPSRLRRDRTAACDTFDVPPVRLCASRSGQGGRLDYYRAALRPSRQGLPERHAIRAVRPRRWVFKEYIRHRITAIVLLAGDVECLEKAGRDLYDFYTASGYRVIHLPISDFGVPSKGELAKAVSETLQLAVQGHNTAIHCSGGIGRTGMFTGVHGARGTRPWAGRSHCLGQGAHPRGCSDGRPAADGY